MIIRRLLVLVVMCLAVVSLAACSKPAPPAGGAAADSGSSAPAAEPASAPASTALPHACDLLTAKDAEEVMGPGAQLIRDSVDTCVLATPSPIGPTIGVKIEELSDTWDGGDFMMTMSKDVEKLPDIGEGGYSYMGGSIAFKKGRAEVSVITSNYKGSMSKLDAAKLIAAKVAAKM